MVAPKDDLGQGLPIDGWMVEVVCVLGGLGLGKPGQDGTGERGVLEGLVTELVTVDDLDGGILRDPSGQRTLARPDPADQSHDRGAIVLYHGVVL